MNSMVNKNKTIFSMQDQEVSYEGHPALHGITLDIFKGEKIALIGPSGCGKTTLLRTLFEQQPKKCSFIHQDFAIVDQLTVYNNVYMGRLDQYSVYQNIKNLILPVSECEIEISSILNEVGIPEKIHTRAGELSGGQKQRVAVARALYHCRDILLADEPVSSVDPHRAEELIASIVQSAETTVVSVHNVQLAIKYVHRLIGIKDGRILFDGLAEHISKENLDELYAIQL